MSGNWPVDRIDPFHYYKGMNRKASAILICLSMYGCSSAKHEISTSAQGIISKAQSSLQASNEIKNIAISTIELPTVQGESVALDAQMRIIELSETISQNQISIRQGGTGIQTSLTRVQDITPWWARLGSNLAIAAIVVGVIILLWQTGLGMLIKKAVWALGWFIPKSTMRSAAADMKVLNRDNEMAHREAIAIRRSSDPAYEAARKKLRRNTL